MDLVGKTIGQYRLLEELGRGGTGIVFRAWQDSLKRVVAFKLLDPESARREDIRDRFFREATAAARLRHPNVIQVIETVRGEENCGYAMEFLDGTSLENLLGGGRLNLARALPIFRAVCLGVAAAHEAGMIHGDLKPSNILLDREGAQVKVADFGMARLLGKIDADATKEHSRRVLGTINYMAPELRVETPASDHRADIYSLGVILYRMLTGSLPLGSFRLPSHFDREIPPSLDRVILRCLRTSPGERYSSVGDLLRDLGEEGGGMFGRLRSRRLLPVLGGVLGLVVLLAVAAVFWPEEGACPPPDERTARVSARAAETEGLAAARRLAGQGQVREALASLESFIGKYPEHPEAEAVWREIGDLRRRQGDRRGALVAYGSIKGTAVPEVVFRRGEILSELGEKPAAIRTWRFLRDQWPGSPWAPKALLNLGRLQEAMGNDMFTNIFGGRSSSPQLRAAAATLEELVHEYPGTEEAAAGSADLARIYGPDGLDQPEAALRWREAVSGK